MNIAKLMVFFLHSISAKYSEGLKWIEANYGLAGLGFYWKAVEALIECNRGVYIHFFERFNKPQLHFKDGYNIIYASGLFEIDKDFNVTLAPVSYNELGIGKSSYKVYFKQLNSYADPQAQAQTGPQVQAQGGPQAHTPAVPLNREEIDKEMERQKEREIRTQFNRFMRFSCPHLLDMQEPLSLEEYRELKKNYTWNQIQDVLVSMENELGLDQRKRSCYQTALAWLKKRHGEPQGSNKNNGKGILCGLDENGSPIYK